MRATAEFGRLKINGGGLQNFVRDGDMACRRAASNQCRGGHEKLGFLGPVTLVNGFIEISQMQAERGPHV